MAQKPLNVGLIGCGEAAQVIHIPVLNQLYFKFKITYLCSSSPEALAFCSKRVLNHNPECTSDPSILCASSNVDVVFVLSSDELHPRHTILALASNKHVFVEKPLAMTIADAHTILQAETLSTGRVFVGYMRRYATAFNDLREETKQLEKILYARVRDIIGPSTTFVEQSSIFPRTFTDYPVKDTQERAELLSQTLKHALEVECQVRATPNLISQYINLFSLGSHDSSALREVLGMPEAVLCASLRDEFWNVLFKFPGYTVSYESGFHNIPLFDSHIEIYGEDKSVLVQWDNPYVRNLAVTTTTRQRVDDGGFKETHMRRTYEDPFVLQLYAFHDMVVKNEVPRTSAEDAVLDIRIWQMIVRAAV